MTTDVTDELHHRFYYPRRELPENGEGSGTEQDQKDVVQTARN